MLNARHSSVWGVYSRYLANLSDIVSFKKDHAEAAPSTIDFPFSFCWASPSPPLWVSSCFSLTSRSLTDSSSLKRCSSSTWPAISRMLLASWYRYSWRSSKNVKGLQKTYPVSMLSLHHWTGFYNLGPIQCIKKCALNIQYIIGSSMKDLVRTTGSSGCEYDLCYLLHRGRTSVLPATLDWKPLWPDGEKFRYFA